MDIELIEIRYFTIKVEGDEGTTIPGQQIAGDDPQADPPPLHDTPDVYVVVDGDSLYNIAATQLGDGARWQEIYDLNADAIGTDPNELTPSMLLDLPSDGNGNAAVTDDTGV